MKIFQGRRDEFMKEWAKLHTLKLYVIWLCWVNQRDSMEEMMCARTWMDDTTLEMKTKRGVWY